ncbi:MAG TPA: hypothetical protein VLM40_04590, partial [Gemmata sp.]|nr:hypothetical protein [Gemmata sp.]
MFLTRIASSIALPLLLFTFLLVTVPRVSAQQPAAAPADQAAINRAIDNGVRYLRAVQTPSGTWGEGTGAGSGKGWGVGYTALAGVALVECGVSTSDPGLRRAHAWVKSYVGELDQTYEVSLAILFLDQMGDKRDRRLIQVLASRLIAGQSATGGWGYKVPKLTSGQQEQLLGALRKMNPPAPPPAPSMRSRPSSLGLCIKASEDVRPDPASNFDPEKARAAAIASLPKGMKQLPVFGGRGGIALEADPKDKRNDPIVGTTDNSNTHFAMLAMWAARKHEIPVERSLELLANRFRTSQGGDGTWGYDYSKNGGGGSQAFTCVALLGLAIGHVVDPEVAVTPEKDP